VNVILDKKDKDAQSFSQLNYKELIDIKQKLVMIPIHNASQITVAGEQPTFGFIQRDEL